MPIGVAVCFGPALVVWLLTGRKESTPSNRQGRK